MYDLCQHFNCLPQAGGLFDQDPLLIWAMQLVAAAYEDKRKAEEMHQQAEANARKLKGKK